MTCLGTFCWSVDLVVCASPRASACAIMHVGSLRSGRCIFCTYRSNAAFSTSAAAHASPRPSRRSERLQSGDGLDYKRRTYNAPRGGTTRSQLKADYKPAKGKQPAPDKAKPQFFNTATERVFQFKKPKPVDLIASTFDDFQLRLFEDPILARLELSQKDLANEYKAYVDDVKRRISSTDGSKDFMLDRLMKAVGSRFLKHKSNSFLVDVEVRAGFYAHVLKDKLDPVTTKSQARLVNFQNPAEWWPGARHVKRTIHMHVGPTNSGKTYRALKRLEASESGIYAGPLRLLAHEIFTRLNAAGKVCNLLTGDDMRLGDPSGTGRALMTSCTVEMIPTRTDLDVAVIDEIQMIAHPERGWAWTQAVMGVRAKEVHLCGEARAVPIIKNLMASLGDEVIVHDYARLSPLEMAPQSLDGNLGKLKKGDCIVAFNIFTIHGLRRIVEERTGKKCAIVYGSLPPETRAQQARLFNDPDNDYDYLVASNAVGMGLNLSIRRIIFHSSVHFNGTDQFIPIEPSEIKQIGGRAGRFSSSFEDVTKGKSVDVDDGAAEDVSASAPPAKPRAPGLVTTLETMDYANISKGMSAELQPITKMGILPPEDIMARFARYFPPKTPTSYILIRMLELTQPGSEYFLCDLKQAVGVADVIEEIEELNWGERLTFFQAPIAPDKAHEGELTRELARVVADKRAVSVLDIKSLDLDLLESDQEMDRRYLRALENLHTGVVLLMWLSYRFVHNFVDVELTKHVKGLVEKRIEEVLEKQSMYYDHEKAIRKRERAIQDLLASADRSETDSTVAHIGFDAPADPSRELMDRASVELGPSGPDGMPASQTGVSALPQG